MPSRHRPARDQAERDAAGRERDRNVLIDAGAGTGKTTILIDRLVSMVAPETGPAVPITRVAAITFTRKAAGELRLRIREELLRALAEPGAAGERRGHLLDALAGLDTAYIGTIHSFADRLLRLRPVEAQLSPSYEIAEDDGDLVHETFEVLLHAVENQTLRDELAGTPAVERADEVIRTVLLTLEAGLLPESQESLHHTRFGLDALVEGFIRLRDMPPPDAPPVPFDAVAFSAGVDAFLHHARAVTGASPGTRWIRAAADLLASSRDLEDPVVLFGLLRSLLERQPRKVTKRDTFAGDDVAWKAWQAFGKGEKGGEPLCDAICVPVHRCIATRLVRLFPVVVVLYEKVKSRHRALDQLDLLVKLRDLLVANRAVRAEFQGMFDHVFVDEFQDTDPLQAEIVLFLCERGAEAARWDDVQLREHALTLVGDPKQSIYRFRRADVAMYDAVRLVVERGPHLTVRLSANFRSVPPLIGWLNDRFARVLETSPDGRPFDRATGRVFHAALDAGREGSGAPAVHILPFDFGDARKHRVDDYRVLEGRALARYLWWLVDASGMTIEDPIDGRHRRVRFGDVAVLAVSTWRVSLLFPALDDAGIPYASRGGTLFLSDPLHRQFLLGLRSLADRDDGVAEAALLRPPFFAVDPADLLLEREDADSPDERVRRAREARVIVRELRRRRFDRAPGATARDLLEHTAFARAVARGPNGAQRLARLRELCLLLEQRAAEDGLDYDAVTAELREWVDAPAQVDPPYPVGTEAIQILTVHQAKGLEFPVVVLWDGKGQWDTRVQLEPWRMERDGPGWILNLEGLSSEEPPGLGLRDTERRYLDAERRRVVYVAATRARDLLVVPRAGQVKPGKLVCGDLLEGCEPALTHELPPYRGDAPPPWATIAPADAVATADGAAVEHDVMARWAAAGAEAARPRFKPASVSGEAHALQAVAPGDLEETPTAKPRAGRFGPLFGTVVHAAIGLVLRDEGLSVEEAVRRAAGHAGLDEHLDDADADVGRAVETLRAEGLARRPGSDLQLEYPVAGRGESGLLLTGYVDLVSATDDRLDVLDFKTDAPPESTVGEVYPAYAWQAATYGRLLSAAGVAPGRPSRCGLLFTADGGIRWL